MYDIVPTHKVCFLLGGLFKSSVKRARETQGTSEVRKTAPLLRSEYETALTESTAEALQKDAFMADKYVDR
jgi:hypothetical protein